MKTPSQIVWELHGAPAASVATTCTGRCYVCAAPITRGVLATKAIGDNFTDHARCRSSLSDYVCEACVYIMSRTSPVLGRPAKDGKKFGANFRNVSHLWEQGWHSPAFGDAGPAGLGYVNESKGGKAGIRAFLAREHKSPWFAAIGDSGQKHVLMFTPLNGPGRGGVVQFDEQTITVPDDLWLVDAMTGLLTAGVTKDEVGRCDYYVRTMRENRVAVEAFEKAHGDTRGSGWFSLALWLAQRDEEEFQRQDAAKKEAKKNVGRQAKKAARDRDGGDGAGAARRVSRGAKRQAADELLVQNPGPNEVVRKASNERQRMGDAHAAQVAGTKPAQGRLPGLD